MMLYFFLLTLLCVSYDLPVRLTDVHLREGVGGVFHHALHEGVGLIPESSLLAVAFAS